MRIYIGTGILGSVNGLNEQRIATQFFILLIPLFPIQSYFIDHKENKHPIGLNSKSLLKVYGTTLSFIACAFLFYLSFSARPGGDWKDDVTIFSAIIALVVGVYFAFGYGKSTKEDFNQRTLLNLSLDINVLPEWTNNKFKQNIIDKIHLDYPEIANITDDYRLNYKTFIHYYALKAYEESLDRDKFEADFIPNLQIKLLEAMPTNLKEQLYLE
jgi:hypothetical protein